MLTRFFNSQTKTITQGAIILAISTLISRFLGLIRQWLLADRFGAGLLLDIYLAGFRIPDFIYNILIVGGIVVTFLPLFSEYFSEDEDRGWQFTSNVINVFFFLLVLISLLLFIFTPQILKWIIPGFSEAARIQSAEITRLMLLSPIFLGLSSIFSGVLHHFNRFLIYSLCPILYNLGIIFGIVFLSPDMGVLGISLGVVLGAFLHLAIQVPAAINSGFKYQPIFNFQDPGIKRIFKLMFPRIFGIAAQQINLIVITAIASTLSKGSIAIFNFANNLQYLPIGIIGVSFATAAFPRFTQLQANGERKKFMSRFKSIFFKILYLIIPISFLIFIFRNQIVNIVLQHGQFSQVSAQLTSASLGIFCLGLWASALIPLMLRGFFALQDTKTPTLIAVLTVLLNVGLSFSFVSLLGTNSKLWFWLVKTFNLGTIYDIRILGLVLAFSASAIFQFILCLMLFKKKNERT